jgi:hypothetical protein
MITFYTPGNFPVDADAMSFIVSLVIGMLFYLKYKQLETEIEQEEMIENFLE